MQFFIQDLNIFGLSLTPLLASTIWIYDQRLTEFYCKLDFRMEILIMNYAFLCVTLTEMSVSSLSFIHFIDKYKYNPPLNKWIFRAYDRFWELAFQYFLNRCKLFPTCFGFSRIVVNYRPRTNKNNAVGFARDCFQGYTNVTCALTFDISKGRVEVSFPLSEDRHPSPGDPASDRNVYGA